MLSRFARLALLAVVTVGVLPVAAQTPARLVLTDASGKVLVRVEGRGERFIVQGGGREVLGEVKIESDRVKLRDPAGAERWKIKQKEYGAEIEDGSGRRLHRIVKGGGDEWKLEDASQGVLARVKPKETGYEVRDAGGATIAKVKRREAGLVFETEGGARLAELSGTTDARAGLWFALDRLSPAERVALWAFFGNVLR